MAGWYWSGPSDSAFTLVEVLVVLVIIMILAAIAISNFSEAQTRARVAHAKAGLRNAAVAIESYQTDTMTYPPPFGVFAHGRDSWTVLTTPNQYLLPGSYVDAFALDNPFPHTQRLTYEAINEYQQIIETRPSPPISVGPDGQETRWWWIASRGPDQSFGFKPHEAEYPLPERFFYSNLNPGDWLAVVYSGTNGTHSSGNLYFPGGAMAGFASQTMNR